MRDKRVRSIKAFAGRFLVQSHRKSTTGKTAEGDVECSGLQLARPCGESATQNTAEGSGRKRDALE